MRFSLHGICWLKYLNCPRKNSWSRSMPKMMRLMRSGISRSVFQLIVLFELVITRVRDTLLTISGWWVIPDLAVLVQKFSMITVIIFLAVLLAVQMRMVIAILKFGITSSCSSIAMKQVLCISSLSRALIRAWALSVLLLFCSTFTLTMRLISLLIYWKLLKMR